MLTIKIDGKLPGLNEYIHAINDGWAAGNALKQNTQHLICYYISKALGANRPNIDKPVHIGFLWREENRRRDKDNVAAGKKFVIDALVQYGVLAGDGWKVVDSFTDQFKIDKCDPGVTVTIMDVFSKGG